MEIQTPIDVLYTVGESAKLAKLSSFSCVRINEILLYVLSLLSLNLRFKIFKNLRSCKQYDQVFQRLNSFNSLFLLLKVLMQIYILVDDAQFCWRYYRNWNYLEIIELKSTFSIAILRSRANVPIRLGAYQYLFAGYTLIKTNLAFLIVSCDLIIEIIYTCVFLSYFQTAHWLF